MAAEPRIRNHQDLVRRLGDLLTEVPVDHSGVRRLVQDHLRFADGHLGCFSYLAGDVDQVSVLGSDPESLKD